MESHPNNQKYRRPACDADWVPYYDEFVDQYMTQDKSLQHCRDYFKGKYLFDPSEKQWKNQIRKWKLRKYFKGDEAARVLAGTDTAIVVTHRSGNPDEAIRRAERSFKRKRARERSQADSQEAVSPRQASSTSSEDSQSPGTLAKLSPSPSAVVPRPTFTIRTHEEKLLFGIGQYVIDACGLGLRDIQTLQPHAGRQAARSLSSDLAAGRSLFEKGKKQLAMNHWQRARSIFKNPNLLNAWYHETPIRLLFEIARMAHSGHRDVAMALLQDVRSSNEEFLDESDPRYALFSTIGDLNVDHLRELHTRAAHCQYDTLAWRLEKSHERLYEVRLNRALDVLWFDPKADLTEWMSSIDEIDQNLGPNNAYSIYFLLLQAYRYVALEAYHNADEVCNEVTERLKSLQQSDGTIDTFRLGLAYRRLGRQMHAKRQFQSARQIMTKALGQLKNTEQRAAVLIEICQLQEAMAKALNNEMEVMLWGTMLDQLMRDQQREQYDAVQATTQPRKRRRDDDEYNCSTKRHRIEDVTDQPDALNAANLVQPSFIEAAVPMSRTETFNSGADQPYPMAAPTPQQSFSSIPGIPDDRIGSFADIPFSRSNSGIDAFTFFPGGIVYEEPSMEAGNSYPNYDGSPFQPNTNWTFGAPSMDFGQNNIVYSPSGTQ